MKRYEVVLLLDPALKESDRAKALKEFESIVEGSVEQRDEIGLQTLSYDISGVRGNNKAFLVAYVLTLNNEGLDSVKKALLYNKTILKYKIFALTTKQEVFVFTDIVKTMDDIITSWEDKKFGQKTSFFTDDRNEKYITWKAIPMLKKYMTRFGDVKPRKYTGNSVGVQKKLRQAIIRSRELGLLEFIK